MSGDAATSLQNLTKSISPDIGVALRRFPDTILVAALFTAFIVLETEDLFNLPTATIFRISAGLICAFLWSLSVHLAGEARHWPRFTQFALLVAGFFLIAGLFSFPGKVSFTPALFLPGLLISTGLAAYMRRAPGNAAFWLFNHQLWFGAALALLGAILFSAGLSIIVETLEFLFGLRVHGDWHKHIWTIGLGFIGPVTWLSFTPLSFTDEVEEGEQTEFTSRAIALIVKFILVPLILVYTAVLYAYAVKILLDGALPEGRLGQMVLAYGAVGSVTALLAYPTRNSGGQLTAFFWRHWFWLNLGPIILLFLAVYQRISQYGVTEERYLVVLAGIWLALLAVYFAIKGSDRDIRLLPVSICVFLLVASVGPWGAKGFSIYSQKAELAAILENAGLLKDGGIIPADPAKPGLLISDKTRVRSIVRYLNRHEALSRVARWFAGHDRDPFADRQLKEQERMNVVLKIVGVEPFGSTSRERNVSYTVGKFTQQSISGYDRLIGPIALQPGKPSLIQNAQTPNAASQNLTVTLKDGRIEVSKPDGIQVQFVLDNALRRLVPKDKKKRIPYKDRMPVLIEAQNAGAKAAFLVQSFNGQEMDDKIRIRDIKGWLLLAETNN